MEGGLNRGHKEGDIRKEIELVMWGRMKRFLKGAGMSAVLFALFSTNVFADEEIPGDIPVQLTEDGISFGWDNSKETPEMPAAPTEPENPTEQTQPDSSVSSGRSADETEEDSDAGIMSLDGGQLVRDGRITVTEYDSKKGTFRVVIAGVDANQVKEILVPVWSDVNGQDDIIWYEAKRSNNGVYYADVDIRNHKYSMGTYNIHVYVTDKTDKQFYLGSAMQEVEFNKGKLTVTKNNERDYTVELTGIGIPGVKNIQFPTWSVVNGQDDIKWYTLPNNEGSTYRCKISVMDHTGLGKYDVHAYAQMTDGSMIFLGASGFETEAPSGGSVQVLTGNNSGGQFQVKVSEIKNVELIRQIQIPIWSEPDQKDIVWYTANRDANGDYIVNANIANHRYNCGKYTIHAYMTDVTGALQFIGATSYELKPGYQSFWAADVSGTESTFRITLSALVVPGSVKGVRFAVWGAANGQNDIRWYNASGRNGTYTCDVQIANHGEFGQYIVHGYYETEDGSLHFIGATGFNVTKRPMAAQIRIDNINRSAGTFRVTVSGVTAVSGVGKVEIPVWCANDQSDIAWYTAGRVSEGIYAANVRVADHAHHFGNYKAHVYVTANNGAQTCVGGTTANISPLNYVYNMPISSTQYEVGIMGASGNKVQFPTWSNVNGQDDIVWYEGVNRGGGKWNAVVDSARHQSGGAYTTHAYVYSGNSMTGFGITSYSLHKVPTQQGQMLTRANMYSSPTPYLLMVNRSTHKVGVFQKGSNGWNCIRYWDCGDGAPGTPTVEGVFSVGSKGYYFDSGSARCYWYTQFYGNYLFHSVLYHKNGTLMDGRVGMPLSHGCVRLLIENAKWIYDTIPGGTTVVVYH